MSDITVVTVQLDIALRDLIDPLAVCVCTLRQLDKRRKTPGCISDFEYPARLLESSVRFWLRNALPDAITPDAVFRYDPFRGLLAVRYGDKRGGDFVFGEPEGGWA